MMMSTISILLFKLALASESGAHHSEDIPWNMIGLQALNLGILLGILIYVLRKPLVNYFETRRSTYLTAVQKAEEARKVAESERNKIAEQLAELKSTAGANLSQARAETEELKKQMIQEAESLVIALKQDAERTVKHEIEKAKIAIRNELLSQAMQAAQTRLTSQMAETDQRRLQSEFVEKIQVVS